MMRRTVRPVRGYSCALDGINDRVTMGNVLGFERTASRTIAYWFRQGSTPGQQGGHPFSKQNSLGQVGFSIYHNEGQLQFFLQGAPAGGNALGVQTASTTLFSPRRWTPVLITYSGNSNVSGVEFYVGTNSTQSKSTINNTLSASILTSTDFTFGARPGPAAWIQGRFRNIAIWDKVLDSSERAAFFSAGLLGDISGVASSNRLARWNPTLGDNLSSTLPDLDVGFDGSCTNMTTASLRPIYDGELRAT